MTINEKREALRTHCRGRSCHECPLDHVDDKDCDCNFVDGDPEKIERWYAIVFADKQFDDLDMVNSPKHYSLPGDMEVIDVEIATQGVEAVKEHCVCAAIEYLLRHKRKNGDEDVKKAHWWLSKYVEISTEKETE